ncbi:MAG: 4-hydroxybenzoate octaprenyltransferase [Phycisphaerales bacterium]|nr:4-hydroxybenzoate octaprenyltransferase [Phycisphaerales bacterium]
MTRAPTGAALAAALADIKLHHSVFALPFAVLAAFLATPKPVAWPVFGGQLALVVVCMVAARTFAMLVNRLADASIDARNPRTARRAIPAGRMSRRQAAAFAGVAAAGLVAGAAGFLLFFGNAWPIALSPLVLAILAFYSFTKRFTSAAHVFLGLALGVSPPAAAIAVNPPLLWNDFGLAAHTLAGFVPVPMPVGLSWTLWLLAAFVLLWVAGFDIAYALQDLDFDRAEGLRSIPAALGARGALAASRSMHLTAFLCLLLAFRAAPPFGPVFGVAVAGVAVLLILEHAVLARRGTAGLPLAFFTLNGVVSVLLGVAGIVDVLA